MRDLTKQQFDAAIRRHGFQRQPLGYFMVDDRTAVCAANAGPVRRDQLAYLLQERDRVEARRESEKR